MRHRGFFLPVEAAQDRQDDLVTDEDEGGAHAEPPSGREALMSLGLLVVALVSVVGLAKVESPAIKGAVTALGFPYAVVGVVIALLVLAPESIAATRAAARQRVQIALNLGFGSAMASIGLTIPVIAVASIFLGGPLELGLQPVEMVLLAAFVVLSIDPGALAPSPLSHPWGRV